MISDEDPDDALVDAACGGAGEAFAILVRRHQGVAHRVAYLITRNAADADDSIQDAFVNAHRHMCRVRPRSFRAWLLTIVGNEARNRLRARSRRDRYETAAGYTIDPTSASPEADVVDADGRRQLVDAVNRLPERERLVVALRYFSDLTEAETAETLGIPTGTVKSRHARALKRLERVIGATHE